MKKSRMRYASLGFGVLLVMSLLAWASCSSALEPSWKTDTAARISLSIGGSVSGGTAGSSRAIAGESGFLYLQARSGSDDPVLYGPFPVTAGEAVTVSDIPAGNYRFLSLLFVPDLLPGGR